MTRISMLLITKICIRCLSLTKLCIQGEGKALRDLVYIHTKPCTRGSWRGVAGKWVCGGTEAQIFRGNVQTWEEEEEEKVPVCVCPSFLMRRLNTLTVYKASEKQALFNSDL